MFYLCMSIRNVFNWNPFSYKPQLKHQVFGIYIAQPFRFEFMYSSKHNIKPDSSTEGHLSIHFHVAFWQLS